jgi:alkylated DNA repair dioxygenase AlkB
MTDSANFIQYSLLPINLNNNILNELWALRPSEANKITMYGKTIDTPRRFKVYGKTYKFNGMTDDADEDIPDLVLPYLNIINIMDSGYNSVLINWYEDGGEYIGYHSDKTDQLVPNSNIYGISFGSERIMRFKNKVDATTIDFKLEDNSIINMMGGCQSVFQHSIIQTKKVCGKRISLTFRKIISNELEEDQKRYDSEYAIIQEQLRTTSPEYQAVIARDGVAINTIVPVAPKSKKIQILKDYYDEIVNSTPEWRKIKFHGGKIGDGTGPAPSIKFILKNNKFLTDVYNGKEFGNDELNMNIRQNGRLHNIIKDKLKLIENNI